MRVASSRRLRARGVPRRGGGALLADAFGVSSPKHARTPRIAPGATVAAAVRVTPTLALGARVDGLVALVRQRFVIDGIDGGYRPPPVTARGEIDVVLGLP